jgi:hypothetical protein
MASFKLAVDAELYGTSDMLGSHKLNESEERPASEYILLANILPEPSLCSPAVSCDAVRPNLRSARLNHKVGCPTYAP